jgi:hypothetical protein
VIHVKSYSEWADDQPVTPDDDGERDELWCEDCDCYCDCYECDGPTEADYRRAMIKDAYGYAAFTGRDPLGVIGDMVKGGLR